ncbi:cytidine deaminase [Pontibacter arcticus]|uniref:Cytidine deaminase n=1 Tax=Pontibacter arcticus TaxID=2080288 RepID=A0A364RH12_9BACT|nr:cytidine deaminase [Pontibacter arcticus]RAU83557.1 cytidine deaminase [Pontibacter arcticus]
MAHKLDITLHIEVLESVEELNAQESQAMQLAQEAANDAYAPYSNYLVGAALLLEDGTFFKGNNQENAAYPSGLCAERTALFGMSANHPNKIIKMLAVTVRRRNETEHLPALPCGACRQVMAEYESKQNENIMVLLQGPNGTFYRCQSVRDLLPLCFSGKDL